MRILDDIFSAIPQGKQERLKLSWEFSVEEVQQAVDAKISKFQESIKETEKRIEELRKEVK